MDRKQFVQLAGLSTAITLTAGITGCANKKISALPVTGNKTRMDKPLYVPNGKNRFKEQLMIWGIIPLQIKVSGNDTDGSLFIFEHANMSKGGPPKHFHYEQDEWFYVK